MILILILMIPPRYAPHVPLRITHDQAVEASIERLRKILHYPLVYRAPPAQHQIDSNPHRTAKPWDAWPIIESGSGWSKRRRPDGEIRTIIGPMKPYPNPLMQQSPEWNHYRR